MAGKPARPRKRALMGASALWLSQRSGLMSLAGAAQAQTHPPQGPGAQGTGGTDEEPVMTPIEGWHVNVRGPQSDTLTPFAVQVSTPHRVWA